MDTGAEGAVKVGTGEGMDVDVEAEAKVGEGAGAMVRNLRLWLSSSWTYSASGRGIVRWAGAEPVTMTE
jgi:hypothetical protein